VQWLGGGAKPCVVPHEHDFDPPVDVYETEDQIVVKVELSGIAPSEVSVVVENDRLFIHGERRDADPRGQRVYHQLEIAYGSFGRELRLPAPVASDQATAKYRAGFLTIALPKRRIRRPSPTSVPIG
jgi:HSP20 family protein